MKRFIVIIFAILFASSAFAQLFYVDIDATAKRKIKDIDSHTIFEKGEMFEITQMQVVPENQYNEYSYLFTTRDLKCFKVSVPQLGSYLSLSCNDIQGMWDICMFEETLPNILTYGYQSELRDELEMEALQFVSMIEENGLRFNDSYLEGYIYGLVNKIAPKYFLDGRTTDINILLNRNTETNAYCYPNGTIVINLGLLSVLHSEDELVAILSHEIAHYLLDHHIQNINAEIERLQRATFWANFATGLALVADVAIGAKSNGYYTPGALTSATAIIASTIAEDSVVRLGMVYAFNQDQLANAIAMEILTSLGYNPNALTTALKRIDMSNDNARTNYTSLDYFSDSSLQKRAENEGAPYLNSELEYEQKVSLAITDVAAIKFSMGRFRQAIALVNQNIENNIATADDYLLKARCLLNLVSDGDPVEYILEVIDCAKNVDPTNINIYKTEILAYLKADNIEYARTLLQIYYDKLSALLQAQHTESIHTYIVDEIDWAFKMLLKTESILNSRLQ